MSFGLAEADIDDTAENSIPSSENNGEFLLSDTERGAGNAEVEEGRGQELWEETQILIGSGQDDMLGHYARKDILKKYIPVVDPEDDQAMTLRVKVAKRTTMLRIQMAIAASVAVANIGITIWLPFSYPLNSRGIGTFAFSNCKNTSNVNSTLHIALNIVSSLFLGAGNYCMQILVAPSREEIDRAHAKKTSLEIGVPSVKNLRYIGRRRVLAWVLIGIVSTLLHLFWNSAIFTSLPVAAVPRAVATSDFLVAGDNWTAADPLGHYQWWRAAPGYGDASLNTSLVYALQALAVNLTHLDSRSCVQRYVDPLLSTSAVIVVARNMSSAQNNGSSLLDGWVSAWEPWALSSSWVCAAHQPADPSQWKYCNAEFATEFSDHWKLYLFGHSTTVIVDYCLAGDEANNQERCGLHYSAHILRIVCACTLVGSMLIFWTLLQIRRDDNHIKGKNYKRTVVTMGDAIHSFLALPSWVNVDSADCQENSTTPKSDFVEFKQTFWKTEPCVPWFRAMSCSAWALSVLLFALGLAITIYKLSLSMKHLGTIGINMSPSGIWEQGFKVQAAALVYSLGSLNAAGPGSLTRFMGHILVANSPQLFVSISYLFYNNILTRQLVADELVRFLRQDGKKPVRVSSPSGMQRSSYFLSLPWKYSGPLMGLSILLHWLISQSIFLVESSVFGPGADGARLPVYDYSARGFSPLGAILATSLGSVLVAAIIINAFVRHYHDIPQGFQRMAFNSSAIMTLCQRPESDKDAYLFPISIGVINDDTSKLSRCAGKIVFSTDISLMQPPKPETYYLGPVFHHRNHSLGKWVDRARSMVIDFSAAATVGKACQSLGPLLTWRRAERNQRD